MLWGRSLKPAALVCAAIAAILPSRASRSSSSAGVLSFPRDPFTPDEGLVRPEAGFHFVHSDPGVGNLCIVPPRKLSHRLDQISRTICRREKSDRLLDNLITMRNEDAQAWSSDPRLEAEELCGGIPPGFCP